MLVDVPGKVPSVLQSCPQKYPCVNQLVAQKAGTGFRDHPETQTLFLVPQKLDLPAFTLVALSSFIFLKLVIQVVL